MKQFRLVDNILGWVVFAIAAFVYCSTVEPTASFWDCPEFILSGYKLEVGHPPGAPFFMITANLFSQFAGNPSQVALMVNIMNALLSALCIMFLFWTVTHLARKLILSDWSDLTRSRLIAIEASGLVGALIYTFSDTFWFSAVEGEVYAYSSAFTAVVFWLILKWEDHADEPHGNRWLVLIAYMTGLSIGVHLLNLLCIPAIVLVYYYKRFPDADLKGSLIALLVSFVLVFVVLYGIVPGIITVGGWFELLFVNVLDMPFNTGLYIYIVMLLGTVVWGIYESYVDKSNLRQNISFILSIAMLGIPFYGWGVTAAVIGLVVLCALAFVITRRRKGLLLVSAQLKNTVLVCLLMIMIGYSSYALIMIRSAANTPMDQNSPEDIFTLGNYLSRDQYGYRPLLYGQAYTSEYKIDKTGRVEFDKGAPIYQQKEKASADEPDRYFIVSTKDKPVYAQNMFFPRMYSSAHADSYESWFGGTAGQDGSYAGGVEGTLKPSNYNEGGVVKIPTFLENMKFFLSYQCNFMYWRYFMWNFAGRQNDIQGNGEIEHGNWLSGIPFLDNIRLGDQNSLPDELKNNKGRNVFYCLPLLLGIIGLGWQAWYSRKRKVTVNGVDKTVTDPVGIRQFWVVFFLFFMTGLAIVIYLNQTPAQPRERDYAYAGSFYAYAIWCGLGVLAIFEMLRKFIKGNETLVAGAVSLLCLFVPIQMASQTWDDHDRSGRYTCRDFGRNYLMSLQPGSKPVIFTNGDNDTFPLWYNQEVEGVGTDARVCNLQYLYTDWYIDQMKRQAYDSPALPISWKRIEYCEGTNGEIEVQPEAKQEVLEFYKTNPAEARKVFGDKPFELKNILKYWVRSNDPNYKIIPTDTVFITIDKDAVRKSGMMIADSIPDRMPISLAGMRSLNKSQLMTLEMLANSNWTRPLYIAVTVGNDSFIPSLSGTFTQEGLANRITPFVSSQGESKRFDTEKTYDALMNRFKYGGLRTRNLYIDPNTMTMCYHHTRLFIRTALELIKEGKNDKAMKVLAKKEQELPEYNVPVNLQSGGLELIKAYGELGQKARMRHAAESMWNNSLQYVNWYLKLDTDMFKRSFNECLFHLQIMMETSKVVRPYDKGWDKQHEAQLDMLLNRFHQTAKSAGIDM